MRSGAIGPEPNSRQPGDDKGRRPLPEQQTESCMASAELLRTPNAAASDLPSVWPWRDGEARGVSLAPLYKSVPHAALQLSLLHRQDCAEARLAVDDTLIRLRGLSQWVRLDYRFNFSLRDEIKCFVEISGPVLLAANDPNALHDEVHQRDRKRLRVGSHCDQPTVRPQSLNAVHHRLGRIGSTEDHVCAARRGKALSVADNFVGAEIADHLVFIGGVRNRDGLEARSLRVLHC